MSLDRPLKLSFLLPPDNGTDIKEPPTHGGTADVILELQQKLEQVTKERDEHKTKAETYKAELEAQKKLLTEAQQNQSHLLAENARMKQLIENAQQDQATIRAELEKAESQIETIKVLLLNEADLQGHKRE